jgi:type IV secretion system protein TrbE
MQFHKKVKRFLRQLRRQGYPAASQGESKIKRGAMPDGFFFNDLLWYGDGLSQEVAVARGFILEPGAQDSLDDAAKSDLSDRLRVLQATLGEGHTIQARFIVGGAYSRELEGYRLKTEAICDRRRFEWQLWNRTQIHEHYRLATEAGKMRREILVLFFTRVIEGGPRFSISQAALRKHYIDLAARESSAFEEVQGSTLQSLFPECRVQVMGDREHFLHYHRFLNPAVGATVPESVFEAYDPTLSIQQNCLFGDLIQPRIPGVSFQLGEVNHAVLVMRELPKRIGPGLIAHLTGLGFGDFEITLNLYPKSVEAEVKAFEAAANQLAGEANTRPKQAVSLGTQAAMANARIAELERGEARPFDVFFCVRLWHKDAEALISRAALARDAFTKMSGATCHHATNAETARNLFYQTFPGWTFGNYRGFDLATDDQVTADLLPWSATFTGRLDEAEALFDSPRDGLVGLTTQVRRVPQHILLLGITGSGKSLLITSLLAQIAHEFNCILVVDFGLNHATSVQAIGAHPIIITPDAGVTLNYLDLGRLILTAEHLGSAVGLGLQMLRETGPNADQARVSELQGILTAHLNLLYDKAWEDWEGKHPSQAAEAARRAYAANAYLQTMPGYGNTFLDAWAELRDGEAAGDAEVLTFLDGLDEAEVARFQTDPVTRKLVRNVGLSYLSPEEAPTHTQLVELMTWAPIGGREKNPEAVKVGERLSAWKADGIYGKLFDGVSTVRLDEDVAYFELGLIPDSMEEMKAAAHFLVLNRIRQQVIRRPRAERKLALFEEGERILATPGGAQVLRAFYPQMRKFGCVVFTALQQYSMLKTADEVVRSAVFDNTKLFLISAQPSPKAAEEICDALELSPAVRETIKRYPSPEHQTGPVKFSSFLMVAPHPTRRIIGTFQLYASPEVLYCGKSDNETFDRRSAALSQYENIVEGILTEARKESHDNS